MVWSLRDLINNAISVQYLSEWLRVAFHKIIVILGRWRFAGSYFSISFFVMEILQVCLAPSTQRNRCFTSLPFSYNQQTQSTDVIAFAVSPPGHKYCYFQGLFWAWCIFNTADNQDFTALAKKLIKDVKFGTKLFVKIFHQCLKTLTQSVCCVFTYPNTKHYLPVTYSIYSSCCPLLNSTAALCHSYPMTTPHSDRLLLRTAAKRGMSSPTLFS